MNLHPLFGQLPVGILIMYALIEIFKMRSLATSMFWFHVRALLVITGTVVAYITMFTDETTKTAILESRYDLVALIATYENFVWIALAAFTMLSVAYAVRLTIEFGYDKKPFMQKPEVIRLWKWVVIFSNKVLDNILSRVLACIGVVITILAVGIGESIVFKDVDPVIGFIHGLFFKIFY